MYSGEGLALFICGRTWAHHPGRPIADIEALCLERLADTLVEYSLREPCSFVQGRNTLKLHVGTGPIALNQPNSNFNGQLTARSPLHFAEL